MKRVLLISYYYYPSVGGVEHTSQIMIDVIRQNGMDCQVICFNEDAKDGDLVCHHGETTHDVVDGVKITRCGYLRKVASQPLSITYPIELHRIMNEYEPNIVIFHFPNPFLAEFLLYHKKRDFKLIVYYNLDITRQKVLGKLFHGQTMALLKRADVIAPTSPKYIEGSPYLQQFRDKCRVLSCCIDPKKLQMTPQLKARAEAIREKYKGKTICFDVGRHVPYKGMTYLIQASKLLGDDFKILIGGRGRLTESLKQEAAGDDKVEFLGQISDEELSAYYSACDIFCFPSITKNEAFGIVLVEAMYFGKPCVTFTIPGSGVNYVSLDGVTGIECPNSDSKALAKAIQTLAKDTALREKYGRAAKERVEQLFTKETFGKALLNAFEMIEE